MSEENKKEDNKVEETKEQSAKEAHAEEKKPKKRDDVEEKEPRIKVVKEKRVKVTSMSMVQVEEALKNVESSMGGFGSRHAQALLARKAVLNKEVGTIVQKKAA